MQRLQLRARGDAVALLQELLNDVGFSVRVSGVFDPMTELAVRQFQAQHGLVSDGIVFTKTWTKLINASSADLAAVEEKFLREQDVVDLAEALGLELAVVKAVNEVESSGRGFLLDGNPKILFEGHIFWRRLTARGFDPRLFRRGNETVLFENFSRQFYQGGRAEYDRLAKAINIRPNDASFVEAAYESASWGAFQIMGYHGVSLGYADVVSFVGAMNLTEQEHLRAFGRFLDVNGLLPLLQRKDWREFARRYNGAGQVDTYARRLQQAYDRHRKATT